ncbi:uncharacterized protein ARMOST_18566 [Armillaria ostoyae]|uniref:DUF6535 domain-containing protein n=1 Tax=Armillaria ostoyae TaxID=47428 RepID=A0A284S277_ARMOS|nr:uncharacterized protein ARMOST_18566 [Armillaria ostoyae]
MENHQPDLEVGPEKPDDAQEKPASIGMSRGRRCPGTIFGICKREAGMRGRGATDYMKRYGKDFFGEEMSSNGRFWSTYVDEALIFDRGMVETCSDNINALMVFAGLFSAVVSTFVIQSAQNLQPDYTAVSVSLLAQLVGNQQMTPNIPIPLSSSYLTTSFSPSLTDVWVNSLWFFSLTLSLITVFVAFLTQQWLRQYTSVVDISPLSQGRIRQYRYMGLEKWQVPIIIGLLPILLHISLGLFFTGLCIYLFALHAVIAYAVASLSGFVYVAYIVCHFLPLVWYNCPYKTWLMDWMFHTIYSVIPRFLPRFIHRKDLPRTATAREVERVKARDALDTAAISWLHSASLNTSAQQIALEATLPIYLDSQAHGNAESILDEMFKCYTGDPHFSPEVSKPPLEIHENAISSLLGILNLPNPILPKGTWTCLFNYEVWEVSPGTESASSATQLAAKLMEVWQKGLTLGPPNSVEASLFDNVAEARPLQDYLSSPHTEVVSALLNGLSIMTGPLFGPSSPGVLVDVMRMFVDHLYDNTNPQNDDYLVHGISDTIDVIDL